MRTVTEDRAKWIMSVEPGSKIEIRDGAEVLVIPTYDIHTDTAGEQLMQLIRGEGPKFKPGDVLKHTETGEEFDIVDLPAKLFGKVTKRDDNDQDT